MGLTVGHRLWLGFGSIVALIAAAYYFLVHAERAPASAPEEPRAAQTAEAAAGRMGAALDAADAALQAHTRDKSAATRAALARAGADFEAAAAELAKAATGEAQRAQARELAARFAAAGKQAEDGIAALEARAEQVAAFDRFRAEGAALLSQRPPVAGRPNRGRTLRKQNIVADLTAQLQAKGREYAARAAGAPLPQAPGRTALLASISRYEVLADTAAERNWAERVRSWVERGQRQWSSAVPDGMQPRQALGESRQAFAAIRPGIAGQVQANLNADLARLEARIAQADARVLSERQRTGQVLLGLLGASALLALVAIFAARAPLRRLAAFTRPHVDPDLAYQMLKWRGDETRELNVAVRWLVERLQLEAPAAATEVGEPAAQAFRHTRQPMAQLDAQRRVIAANAAFCELTGRAAHALQDTPVDAVWSGDHHDAASIEVMWSFAQDQGEWQGELWVRDADGNVHPQWGYLSRVRDEAGACAGFVLACGDVTAIRIAERQSARTAPAGLANAAMLAQRLRAAASRAQRHDRHAALLHLAVAQLEGVDRILGREEADALMRVAAERLQRILRGHDTVLRMAEDQFVVLLEDVDDPEQVRCVAERILAEFSMPVELSGLELPLHAKIGIALAPGDGAADALPAAAREALARAGQTRGAAFTFFAPELDRRMGANHALAAELSRSDLHTQLALLYRARVAAMDGQRMIGVQACLRWLHPAHGALAPEDFLFAAPNEVTQRLDAWQIAQACSQLHAWGAQNPLPVALELVSARLDVAVLCDSVSAALRAAAPAARQLELEFRVSTLARTDQAEGLFARLSAMGLALSVTVDEVEAFTRSMGLLRRLPLTRVKLGRALVEGIGIGASEQAMARATLTLARSLGVELVADGVDTQAQSTFLRTEGILHQQGSLFGEPAPPQALEVHRAAAHESGSAVV